MPSTWWGERSWAKASQQSSLFAFCCFSSICMGFFLNSNLYKLQPHEIKQTACTSAAQAQPTAGTCVVIKQQNSVTPSLYSLLTLIAAIIQLKPVSPGEAAHPPALQIQLPAARSGFNCRQPTRRRQGNSHGWQKQAEEVFIAAAFQWQSRPQKCVINGDPSVGQKDAQGVGSSDLWHQWETWDRKSVV